MIVLELGDADGGDLFGHRATGLGMGENDLFLRIQELDPLCHETDAGQDNGLLGNLLSANAELERVTFDVCDFEDF